MYSVIIMCLVIILILYLNLKKIANTSILKVDNYNLAKLNKEEFRRNIVLTDTDDEDENNYDILKGSIFKNELYAENNAVHSDADNTIYNTPNASNNNKGNDVPDCPATNTRSYKTRNESISNLSNRSINKHIKNINPPVRYNTRQWAHGRPHEI